MTPTESLLLLITVFYLIECFVWVPARSVRITLKTSRRHRDQHDGRRLSAIRALGNCHGAFALAPVFLPGRLVLGAGRWDTPGAINLSPHKIHRHLRRLTLGTRTVRIMASLLACAIFLWFAPLTLFFGLENAAWFSLPPVAVLHVATLTCFWRAHSRFYPLLKSDRWLVTLEKLLLPPANVRVTSKISLPYLEQLHPVALVSAVAPEALVDYARELLRNGAEQHTLNLLEQALHSQGRTLQQLAPEPKPESTEAQSYCPQCNAQFALNAGTCPDCKTVALRPFQKE